MISIWAGFLVGVVGSLHCVGMCGPLVLALPLTRTERLKIAFQSLVYNAGRVWIYGLLGFMLGLIGWCVEINGFQKILSILIGAIMVLNALSSLKAFASIKVTTLGIGFSKYSGEFVKKLFTIANSRSALRVGMINGLLPCGLVYIALASSVTLGSPIKSMFYMLFFGIGTMPMMLTVMIGGRMFQGLTKRLRAYLPFFTAALGVYLIFRGLNINLGENPQDIIDGVVQMGCH